jgi:hypothetical protein
MRSSAITILAAISVTICCFCFGQDTPTPSLNIRVLTSPRWDGNCLKLTIERANRGTNVVYLPNRGLYGWSSTTEFRNLETTQGKHRWLLIYGASDVPDFDAKPLSSGESIDDDLCLRRTVGVVDMHKHTYRAIPVRGRLKIQALYFRTREEWITNKAQHEEMFRLPPNKWPKVLEPQTTSVTLAIPCSLKSECPADCKVPPPIMPGENVTIPDVFRWNEGWNNDGSELTKTLLHKFSSCRFCNQACLLKNSHFGGNGHNSGDGKCLGIREDRL